MFKLAKSMHLIYLISLWNERKWEVKDCLQRSYLF